MARVTVNEGSTSYHALTFTGPDGAAVTPESLRYRLMDGNGVEMVAWATIPANSTEIEISSTSNMLGENGSKRYLTVEATHSGGDKITQELEYYLVDLRGV